MKLQPYINKLNNSDEYRDFVKENSDSFLVAGFFILDFETGKNMHQVDYYIPSKKKVAAFTLDKKIAVQMMNLVKAKPPEKLDIVTKIDLDALRGILEDEMKNRNITEEIRKIIAILQTVDGKRIWNLNCILSGMGILRAHVEDETESVLKMEKISMMDVIKKVTPEQLRGMMASGGKQMQPQKPEEIEAIAKAKIKKLDELEKQIEKQKSDLKKQIKSKDKSAKEKDKKKYQDK